MAIDLDKVLPYKTIKQVCLLDRRLGFIFYGVQILVFLYIIGFILLFKKGYLEEELAIGQVEIRVRGKSMFKWNNNEYVVDSADVTDPAIEHNAVFIGTRKEMTHQKRGICGNIMYECDQDSDCPKKPPISQGKCGPDGLCEEAGWCPPLDIVSHKKTTEIYQYTNPENFVIWIKAAISFPKLAPNMTYTTMNAPQPVLAEQDPVNVNAYHMKDLLKSADIDPKDPIVQEQGCMLNLRLQWDCNIDSGDGCAAPMLQVKRLDMGKAQGFDFFDAEYLIDKSGFAMADQRFLRREVGYRLLVASKGTGYKTSVTAIMLQVSSGLALLSLASAVADAVMLYVLPERSHYRRYKEEMTPDFSDIRDLKAKRALEAEENELDNLN